MNTVKQHTHRKMPIILHTESSTGWGGQEIRIFQESLKFVECGYRVLLACQHGSGISSHAEKAGLPVFKASKKVG